MHSSRCLDMIHFRSASSPLLVTLLMWTALQRKLHRLFESTWHIYIYIHMATSGLGTAHVIDNVFT